MALFIRQDEERSQLQERIAAELRERNKAKTDFDVTPPDGIEDTQFLQGTKKTTSLGWLWLLVIGLVFVAIIVLIILISIRKNVG